MSTIYTCTFLENKLSSAKDEQQQQFAGNSWQRFDQYIYGLELTLTTAHIARKRFLFEYSNTLAYNKIASYAYNLWESILHTTRPRICVDQQQQLPFKQDTSACDYPANVLRCDMLPTRSLRGHNLIVRTTNDALKCIDIK